MICRYIDIKQISIYRIYIEGSGQYRYLANTESDHGLVNKQLCMYREGQLINFILT